MPANLSALEWSPARDRGASPPTTSPADITLVRRTSSGDEAVAFTVTVGPNGVSRLAPTSPLAPGSSYRVVGKSFCRGDGGEVSAPPDSAFEAGPSAPLPTSLGSIDVARAQISNLVVLPDSLDGTCGSTIVAANTSVSLALSSGAKPWASVLELEVLVDGAPYRTWGGSYPQFEPPPSATATRLFTKCRAASPRYEGAEQGLTPGTHVVAMRGRVAGTDTWLATDPVYVNLSCSEDDGGGGGCSIGTGEVGATWLGCVGLAIAASAARRWRRRGDR